ncbi:MAG: cation-transporting ATPase, partial [Gammaproteobacteria bacterium]|nr:cation-transporting ATPase [Gammaproteobacteria bacterium]
MTETASRPAAVRLDDNRLRIVAPEAFGVGRHGHARRFARRAMALPEIQALNIDPARGEAWLRYRVAADERPAWLQRLATAVAGDGTLLDEAAVPSWLEGSDVALSRCGDTITTLRIIEAGTDTLRVTPGAGAPLRRSDGLQTARAVATRQGIVAADVEGSEARASLRVRFDPARIGRGEAIRTIEEELAAGRMSQVVPEPAPVDFGISNTTLGLSTVGEVIVPAATPLAAGILVVNKLGVIRDAAADLSRGKVGVPLFDTALLTCSIVTGQVLAYALTDWSLRFWQQRWRRQLVDETRRFAREAAPLPVLAERVESGTGTAHPVSLTQVHPGDHVRVAAGNRIPVDGRVVAGLALVDGFPGCTPETPQRRTVGDEVLAGSAVRAGDIVLEVRSSGHRTQAGVVAATLRAAATAVPRERGLHRKSEQLAERSVMPTLATAGVGWAAGDLITVGAILHQDWISGPGLAVPLLTMQQIREALAAGVLVRNPTTFQRLAQSRFIVLDGDEPALSVPMLELAKLESHTTDVDQILRMAAAAALYLGDERASALTDACRARGLAV